MASLWRTAVVLVLNLIITGIPSILCNVLPIDNSEDRVLNLIITGIPSILDREISSEIARI